MEKFGDRVLVETRYLGANVSCIKTNRGLVLIDSPFLPRDAKDWAQTIIQATGSEIAYQINTDHHFDHVLGNSYLTNRVICHKTAAKGLKFWDNKDVLLGVIRGTFSGLGADVEAEILATKIGYAEITFDKTLTLELEDVTIQLEFVGGHSSATILTHYLEENAVFTGDNVEEFFPYFGQARFSMWKELLNRLASMDFDIVVPGHGSVGGKELIDRYCKFFHALEDEVKELMSRGLKVDEMVTNSTLIEFFSLEKMQEEGLTRAWVEDQYRTAAKQIVSEIQNRTT